MGCVDDRPEIVKILCREEELGLLQNNIQKNYQQLQTVENDAEYSSTKSSVSFEDNSSDEFKISSPGKTIGGHAHPCNQQRCVGAFSERPSATFYRPV